MLVDGENARGAGIDRSAQEEAEGGRGVDRQAADRSAIADERCVVSPWIVVQWYRQTRFVTDHMISRTVPQAVAFVNMAESRLAAIVAVSQENATLVYPICRAVRFVIPGRPAGALIQTATQPRLHQIFTGPDYYSA